ncbi:FtsQ-type POTRA domain-containing protein [Nocardioides sp. dk4132]|uniref:cell division protein FtsQ/DivIB n=1 Tax=unclassified Nocardioides TaxID=2615069 RepID=UPI0012977F10|nr:MULTISPECIES: FtsQ-type POTRA domain-containing protein [unclassified Nocardioides]MQW76463.1 FtsQ-type POTRA domain-containing protein [Nocardioides sp. dk4132]QGA07269.1 FtsQ-type POTRA domain-containing protein [Nocardioides sp. dk884]
MARSALPDAEASRRRFARRQWRRRWLTWKYGVAAFLVLLVAGATVWALWFSSWLSVEGVEVRGTSVLDAAAVTEAAQVPDGRALVSVDLAGVEARVEALAPVLDAEVTRQWPDRVLVEIEERTAIAVVELSGRVRGMDADGVLFRDYPKMPDDLPRVQAASGIDSEALRESAAVIAALPGDLAATVDHVEVESIDRISFVLRDDREVLWGSAEETELKAEVLPGLLRQEGSVFDVSVPARPTIQP